MYAKILIVDDSDTDRLIIASMLKEYSVHTACDGLEAISMINRCNDFDLIILDLNMPNMDGFEVLKKLNSEKKYKNQVIILSNYDEIENEIRGLKLGAIDYIRKPIHIESLKTRIEIHIELLRVQRLVEEQLYEQELTFDTIFYQAPIGIAILSGDDPLEDKNYIKVNPLFEQITGRTKEELITDGWVKFTHSDDIKEDMLCFARLQMGEISNYSMEKRFVKPDGSIVWVLMIIAKLNLKNEYSHICLVQDISERKEIEKNLYESERSKSILLAHLPGMAYRCNYDRDWTMQFVSDGCFHLTGYCPDSLINNRDLSFKDIISYKYREALWLEWERIVSLELPFRYEYEITTKQGERKWVLELGQSIYNDLGEVEALEGIILDITDRKEFENHLRYSNEHDSLTGLYNQEYLEKILHEDANSSSNQNRALLAINLSLVQILSLTYGYHYSQELIKRVITKLYSLLDDNHQLYASFANRFVFYIKDYIDINELVSFSELIISKIEPVFKIERISFGIGIVVIDDDNKRDVEQCIKNLLISSERSLNIEDRNVAYCFYDKMMQEQLIREEDIKKALSFIEEDNEETILLLNYQPIHELKTNKIRGFEALARIKSHKLGMISPLEFIPIAEKTKQIITFGNKVIIYSFNFLNKLISMGYTDIIVSINISTIQLLERDFSINLFNLMREMNIAPQNISLEITESMFENNYNEINCIIGELKNQGICISIDDFGTGYSSLAREQELHVNCLKIDKYFIDKLMVLSEEKAITSDIISMAHKQGHSVIAEGVEFDKQFQYLKKYGCDMIQGYLLSKPLNEDRAIEYLKNHRSKIVEIN